MCAVIAQFCGQKDILFYFVGCILQYSPGNLIYLSDRYHKYFINQVFLGPYMNPHFPLDSWPLCFVLVPYFTERPGNSVNKRYVKLSLVFLFTSLEQCLNFTIFYLCRITYVYFR